MTKTYIMNSLVEKMQSPDQDHRFMGLTDLMSEIKQDPGNFIGDESMENKVLQHVLQLVEDKISEVKNQAVKCLGALIKIVRESQMELIVSRLIDFSGSKDEEIRDIAGLALKTITAELPQGSKLAPNACANLTPKLLQQLGNPSTPPETLIETLSILSILISRFPQYVASPELSPQPVPVLIPLLKHSRPAVRKRAILTLAQFLPTTSQAVFDQLLEATVRPGLASRNVEEQRTTVQLVAAVARHSPHKIDSVLGVVTPGVLEAATEEDDELREYALQALEVFVLRCPTEVTPFLNQILHAGVRYIKYDPNYAGDDDEDDEVEMADVDDEDEDSGLDEYSDDEDTSYKIRRSATKLLAALIETRPELLVSFYKDVSPVLISRFGDREETVKLEVWSTYGALLNQTRLYGGISQSNIMDSPGIGGKRKRDDEMEVEDSPSQLLRNQVPMLAKSLLNQLRHPKSSTNVLQAGFSLLNSLVGVLPGSLSSHVVPIISCANGVLSQSATTSNLTLHTTCLTFLVNLFSTHSPPTFTSALPTIVPSLQKALHERHPRIISETFRVFSALLNALKPLKQADWLDSVYEEAVGRLRSSDTDAEVRARAEECIGDLWVCATDVVATKDGREWEAMCRTTGRVEGAIRVITRVAREVDLGTATVNVSIEWLLGVFRKSGKAGKSDAFTCLDVLLRSYKDGIPDELITTLVEQLKHYVSTNDISLLAHALTTLALLLQLSPQKTFPAVEAVYLKDIYVIAHSPLITGSALDSLLQFFSALVDADEQIASHVIPNLVIALQNKSKSEASYSNIAKCIGAVVKSQQAMAAGTVAEFAKHFRKGAKAKESQIVLSLLVLGEIGRFIDFSNQKEPFFSAIEYFGAAEEDIRSAAAFAAGNIAIGNLHCFLPHLVKLVQNDKEKRLLALHALKEVVSNCLPGQLENVAETIWVPLFQDSANSEESTRNVAAACLGRLTSTNPSRYLPQLQARIRDSDPATRATVIAAIRYTFADSRGSLDELLASIVTDFLSSMVDDDLTVRRLALSALNSAARNKPQLIRDHLTTLLPALYKETHVNPDLVHTVQMGPWKHTVDDGLEARKTAYETMYTLLDTCLPKLDLHEFLSRVVVGLADDSDEIKVLSHMMISRLSQVAPTAVIQRLDEMTPALEKTVKGPTVTKDTVKQDLERTAELQRSTLRAVAALNRVTSAGSSSKFDTLVNEIQRGPMAVEFKELVGA